jgi:hypothetical protein
VISWTIRIGTVVVAGRADSQLLLGVALVAVVLATVDQVGGFVVTTGCCGYSGSRSEG